MKFCIHIDINKMQPKRLIFGFGRGIAEVQILKKNVKLAISLKPFGIF